MIYRDYLNRIFFTLNDWQFLIPTIQFVSWSNAEKYSRQFSQKRSKFLSILSKYSQNVYDFCCRLRVSLRNPSNLSQETENAQRNNVRHCRPSSVSSSWLTTEDSDQPNFSLNASQYTYIAEFLRSFYLSSCHSFNFPHFHLPFWKIFHFPLYATILSYSCNTFRKLLWDYCYKDLPSRQFLRIFSFFLQFTDLLHVLSCLSRVSITSY